MIRWRCCLMMAMVLLALTRANDNDEDWERLDENEDNEENAKGQEDEDIYEPTENTKVSTSSRSTLLPTAESLIATRTTQKAPLECYVCTYEVKSPAVVCLDPIKYGVHTMICQSSEDKCFTSVIRKENTFEAVARGCRSGCVGFPDTKCCDSNRCNNQSMAIPHPVPLMFVTGKSDKIILPTVLYFVTILLLLQTVVKVAVV